MKVLIIGNGIAGMSAAIEAAELDDEVILVSPIQSERTQSVMAALIPSAGSRRNQCSS